MSPRFAKFFQAGGRNNHIVAAAIDIFGDAQKPAPGIFFQGEDKGFPLDLDFFRF